MSRNYKTALSAAHLEAAQKTMPGQLILKND